jgi:hypothetical protein
MDMVVKFTISLIGVENQPKTFVSQCLIRKFPVCISWHWGCRCHYRLSGLLVSHSRYFMTIDQLYMPSVSWNIVTTNGIDA